MISGVTDCNMKCPYCGKMKAAQPPGKYKCTLCGNKFVILPDGKIILPQDDVKPNESPAFFICGICFVVFSFLSVAIPNHFGNHHGATATETFHFPLRGGGVYVSPFVGIISVLFLIVAILAHAVALLGGGMAKISEESEKNGITVGVILGILWLIFGFCGYIVAFFAILSDVISQ